MAALSSQSVPHIVIIGGHIHDAEVMAGALAVKFLQSGGKATLIHTTYGEKGHPNMPYDDYRKIKIQEAEATARCWGAELIMLPYGDAELPYTRATIRELADHMRRITPTCVVTHWRGSFHPDHYKTHILTTAALTEACDPLSSLEGRALKPPHLWYAENWEDMTGFKAEHLVDISDEYALWHKGMMMQGLFRGEVSKFPYREYYEGLTASRGALKRCQRAIALMTSPFSAKPAVSEFRIA